MLRPETASYLDEVQRHAERTLQFRDEIGTLVELGVAPAVKASWEELLFTAKFVTNASSVLRRVGPSSEETTKLSAEFSSAIERGAASLKLVLVGASKETTQLFQGKFLSPTTTSLGSLLAFFAELTLLKNHSLDHTQRRP